MNSVHDMGGMEGFGPIKAEPENEEPTFHEVWEGRVYGISRALVNFEPALRGPLKAAGFLTRDSRKVERKKYGRAKARKSFQFSKR
mgnify:CR=1 FL=1